MITVVVNPAAGRGQDFDRLCKRLTHAVGQSRPDRGNAIAFKVERAQRRSDRGVARLRYSLDSRQTAHRIGSPHGVSPEFRGCERQPYNASASILHPFDAHRTNCHGDDGITLL